MNRRFVVLMYSPPGQSQRFGGWAVADWLNEREWVCMSNGEPYTFSFADHAACFAETLNMAAERLGLLHEDGGPA